jgi:hypothetical protein
MKTRAKFVHVGHAMRGAELELVGAERKRFCTPVMPRAGLKSKILGPNKNVSATF